MSEAQDSCILYGGWSDVAKATKDIQKICKKVKAQIEANTKRQYSTFKAVEFKSQLVQGENYLVKICVGKNNYIHAKMWEELPCYGGAVSLTDVKENKAKVDPLDFDEMN